jgi:hypothetical protein
LGVVVCRHAGSFFVVKGTLIGVAMVLIHALALEANLSSTSWCTPANSWEAPRRLFASPHRPTTAIAVYTN